MRLALSAGGRLVLGLDRPAGAAPRFAAVCARQDQRAAGDGTADARGPHRHGQRKIAGDARTGGDRNAAHVLAGRGAHDLGHCGRPDALVGIVF